MEQAGTVQVDFMELEVDSSHFEQRHNQGFNFIARSANNVNPIVQLKRQNKRDEKTINRICFILNRLCWNT